jgi:hypothetical protein
LAGPARFFACFLDRKSLNLTAELGPRFWPTPCNFCSIGSLTLDGEPLRHVWRRIHPFSCTTLFLILANH